LLHGFPYDVRQYDAVRDQLAEPSRRLIVPYLRGYGPTRYKTKDVFRSGQQAALGKDVIDLLDALGIQQAVLVGYDWGGRAACVAAALWPERVSGLFSASGYAVQNIAKAASTPGTAQEEYAFWYQSYFNTERGRLGLEENREEFCKFLWQLWSPTWRFTDGEYARTAASFQNPDFVATVIQSYRHRYANAPGDPALEKWEAKLAKQPVIAVPTIVLHGADDRVEPPSTVGGQDQRFTGLYSLKILPGIGHCVPAEAPQAVSQAVESLLALSTSSVAK
jgi:pimeloyl-ACP methyl ester carboxylesterase